ncbi:diacylglycerol lipase-alpha isoform X2 [Neocloeon triangulifer]|uniref:diacylglycerol lipase-alpha isoform X2 n=1 Tax=Neocloeon triangulifer TaxID=2078957 RepID=UPI00286F4610|nr:diacylglycerol lipase-alpha isoform X2 [Neocloeon triangulifer]
MPGLVFFRRRWSVGSDDLVVPGIFLFLLHTIWAVVVVVLLTSQSLWRTEECVALLRVHLGVYLGLLSVAMALELGIAAVAMRGSILDTEPRAPMQYLLYTRLGVIGLELVWLALGVVWLVYHYADCPIDSSREAVLGLIVGNGCVLASVAVTIWCTFDAAGRSWVKMKKYQRSMKEAESKFQYRRSGSRQRNWRQRKVLRAYQDSWDHRCRLLFCCMGNSDRSRNSFSDIARLLSDFFRDLDVVPSDVIAGLVLLRKMQKSQREAIVAQHCNDTYAFLSGVPVTPRAKFVALSEPEELAEFQTVIHYMHFALGAYGWPMYMVTHSIWGICKLCTKLRCSCFPRLCGKREREDASVMFEDNCCQCNVAALREQVERGQVEVVYATYHVDVGQTPFFVALDYARRKVVLSIRGTLSMKDVITDLNAEGEPLPLHPPKEDWLGHKGMVQAAAYIRDKINEEGILARAFSRDPSKGTHEFDLVLVGHSLGAGTAAILAILLRQEHPGLRCYAYSPPGGLLSMPAVQYSQEFTISIVVGKDVVPRIGLHQMESLRADLINAIKRSKDPKWKTIAGGMVCCCGPHQMEGNEDKVSNSGAEPGSEAVVVSEAERDAARDDITHPTDSSIALTVHQPLYPPGKILHVVRHHPTKGEQVLRKNEPVYQALWVDNTDFDEVLISPVMIQDHMPDKVLEALEKVVTHIGPAKPRRHSMTPSDKAPTECSSKTLVINSEFSEHTLLLQNTPASPKSLTPPHKLCLETSFTSLNPSHRSSTSSNSATPVAMTPFTLHPSLPWEYASALEDQLKTMAARSTSTPSSVVQNKKLDLIHDDWFGLAPLATPESLSEVSSISSRTGSLLHGIAQHYPMLFSPRLGKKVGPVVYKPACLNNSNKCTPTPTETNNQLELASSLNESIDLSFTSANSTPNKSINNNIIVDVHQMDLNGRFKPLMASSPKQVTFNLVESETNGLLLSPPSPPSSTLSTHLYFVGCGSVGESPEDEDSGFGRNGQGYRQMRLLAPPNGRKAHSDEESGAPSDDVSPLPLLTPLGAESPNAGLMARVVKGESSV